MKKILAIICLLATMIFSANCQAYDYAGDGFGYSGDVTDLKDFIGDWYDSKGNWVCTLSSDYKINGCTIMKVAWTNNEYEHGYKIIYREGNQDKSVIVWWHPYNKGIEHKILFVTLDGKNWQALRKTKQPHYFESIGGIYLEMDKDEVIKLYGAPSKIDNSNYHSVWTYEKQGFDLFIEGGIVTCIRIYPYGDRKFDRSGLSARNSRAAFERVYGEYLDNFFNFNIGHEEWIVFKDEGSMLFNKGDKKCVALTLCVNSVFNI